MKLEAEGIGKNIEKAVEAALFELKAPREDVDIKILSEGGLFKKARVLVTISDDAKDKYVKREQKTEKKEVKKEVKEAKTEQKEIAKEVKKEVKQEVKAEKTEQKERVAAKQDKTVDPTTFLQGFFKTLGKDVEIATIEDDKFITYSVTGDNLGDVIGRHGETFNAISNLLVAVTGRQEKRILLDIANYREKRAESLSNMARRIAGKVAKTGRYQKLEPMNPSERRIIHTALQDDDRVTTLSKGTEPHRYVIIFPKEYDEKR